MVQSTITMKERAVHLARFPNPLAFVSQAGTLSTSFGIHSVCVLLESCPPMKRILFSF